MRTTLGPAVLRGLLPLPSSRRPMADLSWQTAAVWLIWAAALLYTASFVLRHGHNLPAYDEFAFISITYASATEQFEWLGARHMEHRFPLARAVFLGLLQITGHDYRAGMWLTVGLLGGSALCLTLAARKLRGHTALADAIFPILFLHGGHTENLLMGYQIAFTITVFALAAFTLVAAYSATPSPGRSALLGAACLFVIANGGWLGLVFVPWLTLWVAWHSWRAVRTPSSRAAGIAGILVVVAVGLFLLWSTWILLEVRKDGVARAEAAGLAGRIRAIAEVIGIGLGPGVGVYYTHAKIGWFLIAVQAITVAALAWIGFRRPAERSIAWGLLAVMLGVWVFAFGIGYSRGSGLASRYTSFTALGVAIPFLTVARYAPVGVWPAAMITLIAGVFLVPANNRHGKDQGVELDARYRSIVHDIGTGMPIDVLADRHVDFWLRTREGWLKLWEEKFPLLENVPPAVEKRPTKRANFQYEGEQKDRHLIYNRYKVALPETKPVSFVRVKFKPLDQVTWEPIAFEWNDPATGEKRKSVVKPWVRPINQDAVFWINGPLAEGKLIMGRPECRFDIQSVEYVARPERE